jgi:hypothetical protein
MGTYLVPFSVMYHTSTYPPALVPFIPHFLATSYSTRDAVFYRPASQQLTAGDSVVSWLVVDEYPNTASALEVSESTVQV